MQNSRHIYKGQQIEEPREWADMQVEGSFGDNKSDFTIKFDNLTFVGETAKKIIQDLKDTGYFEGKPYRIEVGEQGSPVYLFDGFLDATDAPIFKGAGDGCEIQLSLKERQGRDWLEDNAKSFSYRYLADPSNTVRGSITQDDYVRVPYIINYIPDTMQLLFLSLAAFSLTKSLVDSVRSISSQTVDLIDAVTPAIGGNVGGPVTSWSPGKIIGAIVNIGIDVAFAIATTIALVKLTQQIIEQLVPAKRFHLGMTLRRLFEKACEHLGLEFQSSIEELSWVMIPHKDHKGGDPPEYLPQAGWVEHGYPTTIDGMDNLGDMISVWGGAFNADYKIVNGVLQFERKDFWKGTASFQIEDSFTNQSDRRNEHKKNTDEIRASIEILWGDDQQDLNTINNQSGRSFQVITRPKTVTDPDLVNIKGSEKVSIPASMAIRKDALTAIEEVLKVFLQAADFLSGQLDSPNSFAAEFAARIGSMHLSSHELKKPKMVVMAGNQLAVGQRELLDSRLLWFEYHHIKSFDPLDPDNNQQYIYEKQKIKFCFKDFVSLSGNNFVIAPTGEIAELVDFVWKVEENTATVTYRVPRVYDTNLELSFQTI